MNVLHIWPEQPKRRDGSIILSASMEAPGAERKVLWYSVPESEESSLAVNADPFVIGFIYLIMESGCNVQVHGEVSPSLLRNLEEFQAAWTAWIPGLRSAAIFADREAEATPSGSREDAAVAFSGGVDSCFTAFRHARAHGPRIPYHPTAGIMVHGFDIPLGDVEVFASSASRSERMLSSLGIALITVATNYREIVADWSHSHGAAIASCLHLFCRRFSKGLIAQSFTYKEILSIHEGVNALTDPLLSSDSFRIIPDGAAFKRTEKIEAMGNWVEFLNNLRVCWQGPYKDRNCCVCEKCVRNILTFRALGLGLPPCFDHDVEDEQIKTLRLGAGPLPSFRYDKLASVAAAHGATGPWVRTLLKRLNTVRRERESRFFRYVYRMQYYAGRVSARIRRGGRQ
ncbi:MAG: hypothetical protein JW943_08845 [Deltaproteobacteria bacterium]|nr:hypothetical protein [Deltaproteobacteria bacterium]